jgi:hypothetical protein
MTRDEILALEAGAELDRLVAEHVFGETYPRPHLLMCNFDGSPWMEDTPPLYSLLMSDAWRVVEHFTKQGKALRIESNGAGYWEVANHNFESVPLEGWTWDDFDMSGHGDTAPLAICRFALASTLQ